MAQCEEDVGKNKRVQAVLAAIRARARDVTAADGTVISAEELRTWGVRIVSKNTFPTAAGLASSAAGYAAMVAAAAQVFNVEEQVADELTTIARMGSGSACRSLYGGFVKWEMGERADGADSRAVQVAPESHWPELRVLIAVVHDGRKDTGSTVGMQLSVETSPLLKHRAEAVVPGRMVAMEKAFMDKDFETFAQLTMGDSNQFHATCLDTFPPIFYMNDTSRALVRVVHRINDFMGKAVAAYTFDAGPNAVIYTTEEHQAMVLAVLLRHFPPSAAGSASGLLDFSKYVSNPAVWEAAQSVTVPAELLPGEGQAIEGCVRHIYATSMGDGFRVLDASEALADISTGLPRDD